ncbi:MAG: ImmA/IrrE family metallo-endopeptidase [Candidatus Helarchaeota archaeon]
MAHQLAYINPKILKWAREQSGLTLKEVVGRYFSPIKLRKAENGQVKLTFNQLRILARKYRRPLSFFYLKNPPNEENLIDDFRTLNSKKVKFTSLLREQIMKIREKRELAISFQKYDKIYDYSWINLISIDDDPEKAAKEILNFLNLKIEDRTKWKNDYDAFYGWKKVIEEKGVLIFQISKIAITEMRGFSISDIPYPTIVINRSDTPLGRLFTIIHEFCHIMLKKGGICSITNDENNHSKVETFCNAVAGAVLVPNNILINTETVKEHKTGEIWSSDELISLKKYFWVSQEVILRRLLKNNMTTKKFYQKMRNYWSKLTKKESTGGIEKQYNKVLRINSRSFIEIVLNAMYDKQINLVDVSYYLDMSLKHLNDLETSLEG